MLGFYIPPTAKVIQRRDHGLKSHQEDWRSPGSNSRPLVYKSTFTRDFLHSFHMHKFDGFVVYELTDFDEYAFYKAYRFYDRSLSYQQNNYMEGSGSATIK